MMSEDSIKSCPELGHLRDKGIVVDGDRLSAVGMERLTTDL
jgi:hypothetical protein